MIPYSLHVAIILSICLFFYKLLLQRQTYYRLNRIVLLTCLALAFLLPLVPVPQQYSLLNADQPVSNTLQQPVPGNINTFTPPLVTAPSQQNVQLQAQPEARQSIFNKQTLISCIIAVYWFGVGAFALNFLVQIVVLLYQSYTQPAIVDGIYRIVELDADKAPCSFGHHIFINPAKYDWETYNRILLHEKIHIKERHSIDLILAELVLVVQWFNPFAWLYRKDVENNLEFLTDDAVVRQHQVDAQAYQWSLLQVAVPNYGMRVTTGYNQSRLKRRILMMDAKRSDVHTLWKYFMLMPLLALLVCGLNKPVAVSKPITYAKVQPRQPEVQQKADTVLPKAKKPVVKNPKPVSSISKTAAQSSAVSSSSLFSGDSSLFKGGTAKKDPNHSPGAMLDAQVIARELYKMHRITDTNNVAISFSDTSLVVNGIKQPEAIRRQILNNFRRGSNPNAPKYTYRVDPNNPLQVIATKLPDPQGAFRNTYPLRGPYGTREGNKRYDEAAKDIIADLGKDGLLPNANNVVFHLSQTEFILNNTKQSDAVFKKYRAKYVPADAGSNWVWNHSQQHDHSPQ